MKNTTIVWTIVVIIILGVGAILISHKSNQYATSSTTTNTSADTTTTSSTTDTSVPAQTTTPQGTVVLNTSTNTKIGSFLVGKNSMTLYTYGKDSAGVSTCTGTCATNWPPYTVTTVVGLLAEPGVNGTIGTITRADGSTQLTYNGYPLYYWHGDVKAGDTTGDGVNSFAVVKP